MFEEYEKKIAFKFDTQLPPLCVACKYKPIFGVLEGLKTQKMDPDILACNYVRIYLHAIVANILQDL